MMVAVWLRRINTVQRKWVWIAWVILAVALLQVAVWAFDRTVPYAVKSYVAESARPGGVMRVVMEVERTAFCDLRMSRYIEDSAKYRTYISPIFLSASALATLEQQSPNRASVVVEIPSHIAPGPAIYGAVMFYACNPIQKIWPVYFEQIIQFEVLP